MRASKIGNVAASKIHKKSKVNGRFFLEIPSYINFCELYTHHSL